MKNYLTNLGVDIWYSVVNGYVIPNNAPTYPNEKNLMSCNSKSRHVILAALTPRWDATLLKRYGKNSRVSMKVIQKLRRSCFNNIEPNLKI